MNTPVTQKGSLGAQNSVFIYKKLNFNNKMAVVLNQVLRLKWLA